MKILNIMLSRDLGGIQQAFMDYSDALKSCGIEVINVISYRAKITSDSSFYKVVNLGVFDFISVMQLKKIIAKEKIKNKKIKKKELSKQKKLKKIAEKKKIFRTKKNLYNNLFPS